jgi:aspartate carbamoyltransferase regulatory subunit
VGEGKLFIDVSTLRKGTYLLHVQAQQGKQVLKFVKL